MATKIFLDESGFTGDDLYNSDQRFFTIASTIVGDDEARDILASCFPRYQGPEYKFANIWKRETSRHGLRALASKIPTLADRVFLWIIDKRFCLLTKMIDYLVEPGAYEAGYDWYANGWGLRYMNTAHRDLLHYGSEVLYDETVRHWDVFARTPNRANIEEFRKHLEQSEAATRAPLSSLFNLTQRGLTHFLARNPRLEDFEDSSEIQVTSIFSTISWWRQQRREDFELIHDESGAFLRQRDLWDTMLREDFEAPPFTIGNGSEVELPLRVRSTTAVRSLESPAVQLCDVLAGFGAKAGPGLIGGTRDPFILELVEAGAGELTYSGVMPHALYVEGPPARRRGPDMVDRMVELLGPHLKGVAAERSARAKP